MNPTRIPALAGDTITIWAEDEGAVALQVTVRNTDGEIIRQATCHVGVDTLNAVTDAMRRAATHTSPDYPYFDDVAIQGAINARDLRGLDRDDRAEAVRRLLGDGKTPAQLQSHYHVGPYTIARAQRDTAA